MYTLCSLKCMTPSFKKNLVGEGERGALHFPSVVFSQVTHVPPGGNIPPVMPEIGLMMRLLNSSKKNKLFLNPIVKVGSK